MDATLVKRSTVAFSSYICVISHYYQLKRRLLVKIIKLLERTLCNPK